MTYTPRQQEYIDSVDGAAHMSAVKIIGELEQPAACLWQLVNTPANDEMWRGDCGILWVFTDVGTPQEHNVKFCPYCGRAVRVAEWRAQ